MVALLDAAWNWGQQQQPWHERVEERLRKSGRPDRDFQQHLYELQDRWNYFWMGRHDLYMAWLADGAVTDNTLERWEAWMDEQAARDLRIQLNPGRLSVEQLGQLTRVAIQRVARDPGDRWLDGIVEDVLPVVEAEVAAMPARPEAGDREFEPSSVVTDMVQEYLHARQGEGRPAGRASAWAVGSVVDRPRNLDEAAAAGKDGMIDLEFELRGTSKTGRMPRWRHGRIRAPNRGYGPMLARCWR